MKRVSPLVLAAGLLALAAFAGPARETAAPAALPPPQPGTTLFETITLLRWGYGALDWLIPHDNGEPHERKRDRRA